MEHWNHRSLQQHRFQNRRERQNPSFSSSLLDQIYRSIDQTHGLDEHEQRLVQTTIMKKQTNCKMSVFGEEELDLANFQRACLIEKWMDQKKKLSSEKILIRKKSASAREFGRNSRHSMLLNSSSSSSDSSCGGLFSSEAESNYGVSSKSSGYNTNHRPKPIRTSFSTQPERFNDQKINLSQQKSKHDGGGFVKTKSKALKMYGDLKKARQPISPGGRLANFLNFIFSSSAANAKKAKIYQEEASLERKSKSAQASTCSSASAFSRSCLSKTPSSSGGKSTKRSVRFYPASVIVDEDCQPCGHKSLYQDKGRGQNSNNNNSNNIPSARNSISEEISFHIREKNRRIEEAARDLLNNYQRKVECQIMEDDDAASYASSDLFELDNLSAIGGIERYCKKLPVYETTYFDTNRAIANGLIM